MAGLLRCLLGFPLNPVAPDFEVVICEECDESAAGSWPLPSLIAGEVRGRGLARLLRQV